MPKSETIFVCESCGNESISWAGRCPVCGNWNTYREVRQVAEDTRRVIATEPSIPLKLSDLKIGSLVRQSTIGEFDRVLGGGLVPGSVILLGGDPGIGKSTLVFQIASSYTGKTKAAVLYVSGEESPAQIKMRADRMGLSADGLLLLSETNVDSVIEVIDRETPGLLIIDSIQTMYDSAYPSTPGSIVQVRETALKLQRFAKAKHVTTLLVGHVTKEGGVAGPRTLEHLVDVVLYLEGDRYHGTRILRSEKNRFGATDEIGVFAMGEKGLDEVANPSQTFLAERREKIPGSAVTCTIEGTRPFLIEVQALVTPTLFGYPKRSASGFDLNRLQLIVAVLTKRADLKLLTKDIFVNVVGGVRLTEPAADLAVALAIASAERNVALDPKLVAIGEMGLTGEIRQVTHLKKRLTEAKRLGYIRTVTADSIEAAMRATVGR